MVPLLGRLILVLISEENEMKNAAEVECGNNW